MSTVTKGNTYTHKYKDTCYKYTAKQISINRPFITYKPMTVQQVNNLLWMHLLDRDNHGISKSRQTLSPISSNNLFLYNTYPKASYMNDFNNPNMQLAEGKQITCHQENGMYESYQNIQKRWQELDRMSRAAAAADARSRM